MNGMRRHRLCTVLRGGPAIIALGIAGIAFAGSAAAVPRHHYRLLLSRPDTGPGKRCGPREVITRPFSAMYLQSTKRSMEG
jgi:hypothetical protein